MQWEGFLLGIGTINFSGTKFNTVYKINSKISIAVWIDVNYVPIVNPGFLQRTSSLLLFPLCSASSQAAAVVILRFQEVHLISDYLLEKKGKCWLEV